MKMAFLEMPDIAGKIAKIFGYETKNDMLFPMHKTYLHIIQRLCQMRQIPGLDLGSHNSRTREDFCKGSRRQIWNNAF